MDSFSVFSISGPRLLTIHGIAGLYGNKGGEITRYWSRVCNHPSTVRDLWITVYCPWSVVQVLGLTTTFFFIPGFSNPHNPIVIMPDSNPFLDLFH